MQDIEESLPFELLGLDGDNGGEFLNHHVLRWLQKRPKPVFMTRSRPCKKDDNAHVEQKNWTHVRQCFGYERYDNPEVVGLMSELVKGPYGRLVNFFHASLKLERKERTEGKVRRHYGEPKTPLARVLESAQVTEEVGARPSGAPRPPDRSHFSIKTEVEADVASVASGAGNVRRVLHGHAGAVTGLGFQPNGKRLISSSVDGAVKVFGIRV